MFIAFIIVAAILVLVTAFLHALTAPRVEFLMRQYEHDLEMRRFEAKNRPI